MKARALSAAIVSFLLVLSVMAAFVSPTTYSQTIAWGDDENQSGIVLINYVPTAGNTVVVACGGNQGPVTGLVDSLGNSLTELLYASEGGVYGAYTSVWDYVVPSVGITYFQISGDWQYQDCWLVELSPGDSLTSSSTGVGSGVPLGVVSFVPVVGSFVIAVAGDDTGGGYAISDSNFTLLPNIPHTHERGGGEYNDSWTDGATIAPLTGTVPGAWAEIAAAFSFVPPVTTTTTTTTPTTSTTSSTSTATTKSPTTTTTATNSMKFPLSGCGLVGYPPCTTMTSTSLPSTSQFPSEVYSYALLVIIVTLFVVAYSLPRKPRR